jgi:hypothetical protein
VRGRWSDFVLAGACAFLAVGWASASVTALVHDIGATDFITAAAATAAVFYRARRVDPMDMTNANSVCTWPATTRALAKPLEGRE